MNSDTMYQQKREAYRRAGDKAGIRELEHERKMYLYQKRMEQEAQNQEDEN